MTAFVIACAAAVVVALALLLRPLLRVRAQDHASQRQLNAAILREQLAKLDLETGFRHRMIPVSWVDHVDEHVHLNLTKDEAKARWTEKPH